METKLRFNRYVPTQILFGAGMLNKLSEQPMPGKKALIIISNGKSTRANGYLARTEEQLQKAGVETMVFDGVSPNPTVSNVNDGAQVARENKCDFLVALGGGSVMDCAKAIALMATNDGDLWDYVAVGSGKALPIAHTPLPIIAITTTAGTGSETDNAGVITKEDTYEKAFIGDSSLYPKLAIVDPELMLSVPAGFTAFQGFDALFHSIEGYIAKGANLMSDMYALTAIEELAQYLPRAVKDGNDLEARTHVAFANTLSGVVMCLTLLTSEHGMEHALSAYHPNLPHGAGLIMISRAYYAYFVHNHACDERFVRMARALGMPEANKPEDFLTALTRLQEACGVADLKMSDYGIARNEAEKFMHNAREVMGIMFTSDRIAMSDADIVAIYEESWR
ncbi:iron-containing alcohol dehydrogenase [Barnesiella sp. An55]|uniref:iron-containing alcohol dehydrogenase n=1 Tax=Barnesiella sp. An55 TaxID=1965646 RepID=UPI000B37675A|nr:iron-containing alcohol dehydrogenase [Barnesiella sp. An55]OUN71533.1 alcohol dehydrogenase [Barnesiella sp. An55]HIZ26845.1 iron-containing alcohol dehydrogenase [Candidatus Barnesiella merdipullorum]